ncbi:hypothetical protein GW17_00013551 [Ensete ventricosum]|nr:hypothetical protein GW17_00013551 [Ensete ventricosum]
MDGDGSFGCFAKLCVANRRRGSPRVRLTLKLWVPRNWPNRTKGIARGSSPRVHEKAMIFTGMRRLARQRPRSEASAYRNNLRWSWALLRHRKERARTRGVSEDGWYGRTVAGSPPSD